MLSSSLMTLHAQRLSGPPTAVLMYHLEERVGTGKGGPRGSLLPTFFFKLSGAPEGGKNWIIYFPWTHLPFQHSIPPPFPLGEPASRPPSGHHRLIIITQTLSSYPTLSRLLPVIILYKPPDCVLMETSESLFSAPRGVGGWRARDGS